MNAAQPQKELDSLSHLEERITRAVELVNSLKEEKAELESQLTSASAENDTLRQELDELRAERRQVRSRIEKLLKSNGPPVYVRHEIVHNDNVVRRLEAMGAVFVEHEDEIPPGEICVLSAHGVAPEVRENCEKKGLRVVDAVCPLVSKVHAEARRYADSGHLVALIGHANHVEVIGTKGERPDKIVVVESPEDAAELDTDGQPLAVITQTTLSLDDVAATVDVRSYSYHSRVSSVEQVT